MAAGDYKISWRAPGFHCDNFQTRIAYSTDSNFASGVNYYYGSSQYSGETGSGGGNYSDSVDESEGEFLHSPTSTTYYRIEQQIGTSESSSDFGAAASLGLEVYLQVAIEDLSNVAGEKGQKGQKGDTTDKISEGDTSAEVIDTGSNGKFVVKTDGTERLCINSDGDIAFGITDPQLTRGVQISKGGGFQDAPTSYSLANEYLHLGEGEYGDNSNGGLFTMGFGFSEGATNGPAYLGYQETSTNGYTNGALIFATRGVTTDTAPTERLRITDSGSIEIRKNAPQIKFIDTDDTTGNTHTQLIHDGSAFYVDLRHGNSDGQLIIRGQGGGTSVETLRITTNHAVVIAGTSAYSDGTYGEGKLQFNTKIANHVGATSVCDTTNNNTANIIFKNPNGVVGVLRSHSNSVSLNSLSDYRLKENVVSINDGITRLKTLNPVRFNFKTDKDTTLDGFLAHEVSAVPEAVFGIKDGVVTQSMIDSKEVMPEANVGDIIYQDMDQTMLIPLLTAALKEAISKIETLESKVSTLESQ